MDYAAGGKDSKGNQLSLWVIVALQGRSHCFELDGSTRHCVGVGSSPDADLRVEATRSAPIECNLARDGDDIWLIPGWPTNLIRVDSVVVDRPVKLWRRCALEIEGIPFEVRIREEPPTSPDIELPGKQLAAHRDSDGHSPSQDRISVREIVAIEAPREQSFGERWGSTSDAHKPATVSHAALPLDHQDAEWPNASRRGMELLDGPPSSAAPTAVSVRSVTRGSVQPLERLGILAQRRPLTVAAGALIGAMVIAVTMQLGLEALQSFREGVVGSQSGETAVPLSSMMPLCVEFDTSRSNSAGDPGRKRPKCKRLDDMLRSVGPLASSWAAPNERSGSTNAGPQVVPVPTASAEIQH